MELTLLKQPFSICKLKTVPGFGPERGMFFFARTDEELSLVCETPRVPEDALVRDDGWRGFRMLGTLDFSLVGILANVSGLLAENGISIFAVSTFNTDYVFTKADVFERAVKLLRSNGYLVQESK